MKKPIETIHIFKNENPEKREKELEKKLINLIKHLDSRDIMPSKEENNEQQRNES